MMSAWSKFRSALRAFCVARGGNVAITFAFATLPIITGVGFAVDYSHANAVKVAMQQSLDATALILSKEAATDTSDQLKANAVKYFNALFTRPEAQNVSVAATYTTSGGTQVIINGSADVPTSLLNIIGYPSITVTGSSTTKWGSNLLRVALVLDNTGSMADDGKMTALQSATKSLLSQLQNVASNNGDVYVSIVPFVKDVNLGASNYASNYIYWGTPTQDTNLSDNNSWDANNGSCSIGNYSSRSSCTSHSTCSISGYNSQNSCTNAGTCSLSGYNSQNSCTGAGTCSQSSFTTQSTCTSGSCTISGKTTQNSCTSAGNCSNSGQTTQNSCTGSKACTNPSYSSKNQCTNHGGSWGYGSWTAGVWTAPGTWTAGVWTPGSWNQGAWTPLTHNSTNWNGCVMDRGNSTGPDTVGNYDTNAVAPSTTILSTFYAAEQYGSCPQAVMGLNYDWSGMSSLVSNMSPAGNTNQAIGLQLGWMSLVGGGPFTMPAENPSYTYSHIIILLTDGLNTQDRWYSSQNSIDARQKITCDNINAAGITLYTIQVNTGNDPTSTLLQNCAGSPGKYPDTSKFYLLTSANQIVTAFTAIATNLAQLRVAK
ncbi:MAG: pilus assembly protein TadG-related protein [Pseudolabrys sp.]